MGRRQAIVAFSCCFSAPPQLRPPRDPSDDLVRTKIFNNCKKTRLLSITAVNREMEYGANNYGGYDDGGMQEYGVSDGIAFVNVIIVYTLNISCRRRV